MFSQDRKFFRFRFHVGIVPLLACLLLVSLVESATQLVNQCEEIANALQKNPKKVNRLAEDPDTALDILTCVQNTEDPKKLPKVVQNYIQQIPNLIDKVLATKEGLFLFSVYLLYRSNELYIRATNLDKDSKRHQQQFESLTVERKHMKDFIDTDILPQVKNGSTARSELSGKIEKLTEWMKEFADVLLEFLEAIQNDIKLGSGDTIRSITCAVLALVVCANAIQFTKNRWVIFVVCGVCVVSIAYCYNTYRSLGETVDKLELLLNDTAKMRTEIDEYLAVFRIVKIRDNIY